MCVLPVPELPTAMMLSRRIAYSERASSSTRGLVDRRNGGEVETVQALHGREPRLLDPTLHHAPFAVDQLQFSQAQQKANMIEALGSALPSEFVILTQERRQLECLQVMSEQKLGRIGHDAAPVSRPRYVLANVIATWARGRYG